MTNRAGTGADEHVDTLVVGAGLGGLACAHALVRAGRDVRVLESARVAGGVVGTVERGLFRFESGPNTVQAASAEFRTLADELGLASRMVVSSSHASTRHLWHRGRLHALPHSPLGIVATPLLSWRAKWKLATERFRRFRPASELDDPDLRTFFTERLGAEATARLAGAFVRGVYAAELDELGTRSAFPRLWSGCVREGGIVRWLGANRRAPRAELPGPKCKPTDLLSFENGLEELVSALARSLGAHLECSNAALELARDRAGWRVRRQRGSDLRAQHVVLALPAPAAARLLARVPETSAIADVLAKIAHASITLAHLGFAEEGALGPALGFGFLVPPGGGSSAPRMLGTICASNIFAHHAPPQHIAVTSFYATDAIADVRERDFADFAADDFARAIGLPRTPPRAATHVTRWTDVIPRYASGHADRIAAAERELAARAPGLVLAGSYTGGVSVEQVITRGRAVARAIVAEPVNRSGAP